MIPAIVMFSLALVWLSGVLYASGSLGWAAICASWGAGWLGIIYAALFRIAQGRQHEPSSIDTRKP